LAYSRAYSSTANLGPGFDVLAVAIDAFYDEVWAEWGGEGVEVEVSGPYAGLVGDARAVRAVAESMLREAGSSRGVRLRLWKGVPVGRGLGSSGASAAATAVALNRLMGGVYSVRELLRFAGEGERAVAGSPHYDNVAASLLGGAVIVYWDGGEPRVERLKTPTLWFSLVTPMNELPRDKTRFMRSVLPGSVSLEEHVRASSRLAAMIHALYKGDLELLGRMMTQDEIVEPRRSKFVPCYSEVKRAALESGALGFAISGAGPSMIALARDGESARRVAEAMARACTCCEEPMYRAVRAAPGALGGGE